MQAKNPIGNHEIGYLNSSIVVVKHIGMLTKEPVLKQLQNLPETSTIDELMDKLLFLYKVEAGLEQSKNDNVKQHSEVKKKYEKWSR